MEKKVKNVLSSSHSFTLIELLVVIGILAILTAAVIIILNPAEYLKQTRDVTRMNDLTSINQALSVLESQGVTNFGLANTVYVSIPDSTSTCANLGLPTLPSNYSYHCVSISTLQSVNGTGWIPVDFTQSPTLSFSQLPIDPINSTSTDNYYTYVTGGSWQLSTQFESSKYQAKEGSNASYLVGTNTNLAPFVSGLVGWWKLNDGNGLTAADSSGFLNNGTLSTLSSTLPQWQSSLICHNQTSCLGFDGSSGSYVISSSTIPDSSATSVTAWAYPGSISPSNYAILSKRVGNAEPYALNFGSNGTTLDFHVQTSAGWVSYSTPSGAVNLNAWNFVSFTFSGSNYSLYINGVLIVSGTNYVPYTYSPLNIIIGLVYTYPYSCNGYCNFFNGYIQDVRIYNRALSASEIQALYNATK